MSSGFDIGGGGGMIEDVWWWRDFSVSICGLGL